MKNQNIVIASNGKVTYVMVDGKVYGDHVVKVEFIHDHKDKPNDARLLITTDRVPLEGDASDEERLGFMKRLELEALAEYIIGIISTGDVYSEAAE